MILLQSPSALAASNSTITTECKMSDKSQAAITLYTTLVMTIISTLTNRPIESFILAWIAWLPLMRAAAGACIYAGYMIVFIGSWGKDWMDGDSEAQPTGRSRGRRARHSDEDVSFVNHATWWIWHVYLPFSQWLWFVEHYRTASNLILFARGTAIGVQLVAMSMDYKARVIRAVDGGSSVRGARVVSLFMAFLSFIVRISLVCLMGTELAYAAARTAAASRRVFIPIYIVFSLAWAGGSFLFVPGHDSNPLVEDDFEDDWDFATFPFIVRLLSGVFFACFTCTIAFIVFSAASSENGLTIGQYLKCDSVSTWNRIQSILF